MIWLSLLLFGVALLLLTTSRDRSVEKYFPEAVTEEGFEAAIKVRSLQPKKRIQRTKESIKIVFQTLGDRYAIIIAAYVAVVVFGAWYLSTAYIETNTYLAMTTMIVVALFMGYQWLVARRRLNFQKSFPDALNILMSAVTAGESLMQAITFVGQNMDNEIGREFKKMGDRLKLGEDPDTIFKRAVKHFPYPEFIFFTVTLRANINRGGQLKHILARLIRVLVDSRTMEVKKMAMTSEARISAKVVAAIPVAFVVILYNLNPSNINFILHDPDGQWILYYVVGSELLGLFIVWLLVKMVKL